MSSFTKSISIALLVGSTVLAGPIHIPRGDDCPQDCILTLTVQPMQALSTRSDTTTLCIKNDIATRLFTTLPVIPTGFEGDLEAYLQKVVDCGNAQQESQGLIDGPYCVGLESSIETNCPCPDDTPSMPTDGLSDTSFPVDEPTAPVDTPSDVSSDAPSTITDLPSDCDSVPVDTPSVIDDLPSVPTDLPSDCDSVPVDIPSVIDDLPSVPTDLPSDCDSVPVDTPSVIDDLPSVPTDLPSDCDSVPVDTPSIIGEVPTDLPSNCDDEPSAGNSTTTPMAEDCDCPEGPLTDAGGAVAELVKVL